MSLIDFNDYESLMAEAELAPSYRIIYCEHCHKPFDVNLEDADRTADCPYCHRRALTELPKINNRYGLFELWNKELNKIKGRAL